MLLRSEPFREFDRITEAMFSERRARRSLSTPTVGQRVHGSSRPPRRRCPFHRADRGEGSAHRAGDGGWVRAEGDQIQIVGTGPRASSAANCSSERAWTVTRSAPPTKMAYDADHPRRRGGQAPPGRDHPGRRCGSIGHCRLRRRVAEPAQGSTARLPREPCRCRSTHLRLACRGGQRPGLRERGEVGVSISSSRRAVGAVSQIGVGGRARDRHGRNPRRPASCPNPIASSFSACSTTVVSARARLDLDGQQLLEGDTGKHRHPSVVSRLHVIFTVK